MTPKGAAADAKVQAEAGIEYWQQRCAELTAERDQLRQELDDIKRDYAAVRESLFKLMDVKVEFDEEELLARSGKGQSLEELIAELEAEYGPKGAS
jgi:chromosome segregation ATPase